MKLWVISVVFLLFSVPATTSWAQEKILDCGDISISQQVSECAENERQRAEKDLNAEYTAVKKRISLAYKNHKNLGDKLTSALVRAQRAWLAFRDRNCEVEAFEVEANSEAHSTVLNNCVARIDKDRILELRRTAAE